MSKFSSALMMKSPLRCWKTHQKVGLKDSPSGLKNPDGSPKQVNDCEPK